MPVKEPNTHSQSSPDEASTSPVAASIKDKKIKVEEELNIQALNIQDTSTAASANSEVEGASADVNKGSNNAHSAKTNNPSSSGATTSQPAASKATKSESETKSSSKPKQSSSKKSSAQSTSTSLTPQDISHLTSIKNAVGTAGAMRPMLMMQAQMPNIPFWMEKGVLEVPVKQVKAVLEHYEKLQEQGKELNKAQEKIVEEGESVSETLKQLQEMQKGQNGVQMVDDPKEGECSVQ